jgi:peptidoglycan/LPS O-acetylase OafA/YrhL
MQEIAYTAKAQPRIACLDGVRFLAVGSVIIQHYWFLKTPVIGIDFGKAGVDLFLSLSGFLITSQLMTRYQPQNGIARAYFSFWLARSFRIIPLVVLAMIFLSLFPINKPAAFYLYNLTFAHNFYTAQTGGYLPYTGHFWTLGVEMQFYAVFPFIFWCLPRGKRAAGLTILMAALWALTPVINHFLNLKSPQVLLHAMAAPLLMGAILAAIESDELRKSAARAMLVFGLIFCAGRALAMTIVGGTPWPEELNCFLYAGIVGSVPYYPLASRVLSLPPITFIGRISYGIYVWHLVVIVLQPYLPTAVQSPFVMLAITMLFSVSSWYLVEVPLNRMGHRLARRLAEARPLPTSSRVSEPSPEPARASSTAPRPGAAIAVSE